MFDENSQPSETVSQKQKIEMAALKSVNEGDALFEKGKAALNVPDVLTAKKCFLDAVEVCGCLFLPTVLSLLPALFYARSKTTEAHGGTRRHSGVLETPRSSI